MLKHIVCIALLSMSGIAAAQNRTTVTATKSAGKKAYSYNASFPNQPGSYNWNARAQYHFSLGNAAATGARNENGKLSVGVPNGPTGAGITIVEQK